MQVGVRQFRDNLSRWIDAVQRGEDVVITERGRPVARLSPVDGQTTLDRLVAQGLVQPPRAPRRRAPTKLVEASGSVTEFVRDQRR